MKKHLIVIRTAVLLLAVGLSGCISDNDKFVGKWENSIGFVLYTFYDNGKYEGTVTEGTYKIENGKLICESDGGHTVSYHYTFSDDNNILILEGIGTSDYTLKKVRLE